MEIIFLTDKDRKVLDEQIANISDNADAALTSAKAYTDTKIATQVGDLPVSNQISNALANLPQPDWDQSDETASDYIKNRTHYEYNSYVVQDENVNFEPVLAGTIPFTGTITTGDYWEITCNDNYLNIEVPYELPSDIITLYDRDFSCKILYTSGETQLKLVAYNTSYFQEGENVISIFSYNTNEYILPETTMTLTTDSSPESVGMIMFYIDSDETVEDYTFDINYNYDTTYNVKLEYNFELRCYSFSNEYFEISYLEYSPEARIIAYGNDNPSIIVSAYKIAAQPIDEKYLPIIPIEKGGTGSDYAAGALRNLGLTATARELNVLDGITATTAELNILDGVTATTAELNYVDGVTSNIQIQLNDLASQIGDNTSVPYHEHSAYDIYDGTFGGAVVAQRSSQTYSSYLLRNTKLAPSDTDPTYNGEICWTYE